MFKVVLVGCGSIAKSFHLPAWQQVRQAKVIAVIDKDLKIAKIISKKFNISNCYKSLKLALDIHKDANIVHICVPNKFHYKYIITSLKNKKHVICEKPFVLKSNEFKIIERLALKNKLICVSAQHQRYRQPSIDLKKMIQKKELGEIYTSHITALFSKSNSIYNKNFTLKKNYGGPLLDLGSHFIDLAIWLMGNPKPKSVYCLSSNKLLKYNIKNKIYDLSQFDVEDYVVGIIRFKNNTSISFQISYALHTDKISKKLIDFYGTKSSIKWPSMKKTTQIKNRTKIKLFNREEKVPASILQLKYFLKSIKNNQLNQNPSIVEMRSLIYILESLQKSMIFQKEIIL